MAEKHIGQHTSTGPAVNNGQRQTRETDAHVGQRSGGEMQQRAGAACCTRCDD